MRAEPEEVRYAKAGDLHIAYHVGGAGDLDLVHIPGLLFSLEVERQDAGAAEVSERLKRFTRLISFDKRGSGMSDRLPPGAAPSLEERAEDVLAVMDAAGSRRASLFGVADGGPVAMYFAAAFPERTSALVLRSTSARSAWSPECPWGVPPEAAEEFVATIEREWGTGMTAQFFAADDEEQRRRHAQMERLAGTPATAAAVFALSFATDVRDVLASINVPTLVVSHGRHALWPPAGMRYIADHVPGARYVELPGEPKGLGADPAESAILADLFERFLTGRRHVPEIERVLKTVLFTDIVESTRRAAELGDHDWRALLDEHDRVVRDELDTYGGVVVSTTGDGFLATFDGPARAIRCAQAIIDAAGRIGLEVRGSVHTGECQVRGDDIAGIAVHIGARVAALAGPDEVLVTSTVREIVAGSEIEFDDRGMHELKGVPGEWNVLAVRG